jgi:uncharacterized protein (TIGR03118 family)
MLKAISQQRSAWVGSLVLTLISVPAFAQHFTRTDLTVNQPSVSATAPNMDAHLVNAWGLSRSSGSPWWISDNGAGVSTLYNAAGAAQSLVVTIPSPDPNGTSAPTGTVFNYTSGFEVAPGAKAIFLFVTEDGTIAGWNPGVKPTEAVIMVNHAGKAVYKGCTLATTKFGTFLYVTNFQSGEIEVYDSSFHRVRGFRFSSGDGDHDRDDHGERGFVPFNIQNVGGNLVVTYAKKEKGSNDETHGPGLGAVRIFNPFGRLIQRLDRGSFLNAPWGVTESPSDFGVFSHRLLIGNFGDGTINVFNPISGEFEGKLLDSTGAPLWIDGLWALSFGSNGTSGSAIELYFTAGPNDENDGLFGKIAPIAAEQRGNNE